MVAGGRYCPRCGLDTLSSPPASFASHEAATEVPPCGGDWSHLFELARDSAEDEPHVQVNAKPQDASSEIIRGYSAALYKLGRRYESGLHAGGKNAREAMRCYTKAARLGHVMAFARLASRWCDPAQQLRSRLPDPPAPRHG